MYLIKYWLVAGLILFSGMHCSAQRLVFIPNPHSIHDRYMGFNGKAIVYNQKLYIQVTYGTNAHQLAEFDGSTITLIPNPDTIKGHFDGLPGSMVVFKDNLYWQYPNASGIYKLLRFDGTSYHFFPNPDTTVMYGGIGGPFIEYNDNLFFKFERRAIQPVAFHLAKFDGSVISLVPDPDTIEFTWIQDHAIVYDNRLYWTFLHGLMNFGYAVYTGDSLAMITNPDTCFNQKMVAGVIGPPVLFRDNILSPYLNASGNAQLCTYNGHSLSLIENADSGSICLSNSVVYNDELFIPYRSARGNNHLAKYDGNSINLLPMPGSTSEDNYYSVLEDFIVYNSKLYFKLLNDSDIFQLAEYDGNEIKLIPNPDTSYAVWRQGIYGSPFIFYNKLYWSYKNKSDIVQLAAYYNNELHLIANPDSGGLTGDHVLYNNNIYLQYLDQADIFRLVRLEDIPAVIQNFGKTNWQVYPNPASDHFIIEVPAASTENLLWMYNLSGKLVMKQRVVKNKLQISTAELPSGIYFLKLSGSELFEVKKILIM